MKPKATMKPQGTLLIFTGLLLIAAALCLTLYNLYDEHRAARSVSQVMEHIELPDPPAINTPPDATPEYIQEPDMEMPLTNTDGQDYIGVLDIPACALQLPIISQWSDSKLKIAPCRYQGSAYTDDLIIAAHNYRSHFGRLSALTLGDDVTFTDLDGNIFTYKVTEVELLEDTAIEEMLSGEWDLTLFTCTTGNSARVTVRCQRTDIPADI